ncbi:MAG: DegT/DnrJ/EryC1/StrS family aminotransferase [Dehalococcoidia bacterium]|nr:DegT/DnrJ/EryC1/StrS family aminotransferase [Dehalococcoidia bacterium]
MTQKSMTAYYEYEERIKGEKIPYYEPWLGDEELAQLTEVIRANWISEGAKTREFESRLAQLHGTRYALAVANCTGGLIIALKALGIGAGDEVIVPTFTFIASVSSVRLAGATPVLVDVDARTATIDPAAVEQAITPRTKAILPVHLYGHAADLEAVMAIAERHGLAVLEDAAQGLAVKFRDRPVGSFGAIGCLSFFTDKSITLGEGGAVLTNSDSLYEELLMLKNDGRLERGMYVHDRVGYNLRITELQAAVGLAQLGKLDTIVRRKRANEELYRRRLQAIPGLEFTYRDPRCFVVPHRVNVLVDDPEALIAHLEANGIGSRRFYLPVHLQPSFDIKGDFPNAEDLYRRGLSLPSAPTLTEEQIAFVCDKVREFMSGA